MAADKADTGSTDRGPEYTVEKGPLASMHVENALSISAEDQIFLATFTEQQRKKAVRKVSPISKKARSVSGGCSRD